MRDILTAVVISLIATTVLGEGADGPALRTWTSRSGQTIEAKFENTQYGMVYLKKPDGSVLKIGKSKLSLDDRKLIGTLSGLSVQTEWATMENIPVFGNEIKVTHYGKNKTIFTNQSGPPLFWKASFEGDIKELLIDDYKQPFLKEMGSGGQVNSFVIIRVDRGKSYTVSIS